MSSNLGAIDELGDQKAKAEQYRQTLKGILDRQSLEDLNNYVDHVLTDAVGLVVSRQLLQTVAQALGTLPNDIQKAAAEHALASLAPRLVSYEEQATAIREHLAKLYEQEEEWSKAAQTLTGIDLDSGMRVLDNEYKLRQNIRIAMLYLEDADSVNAELYIKKASLLISSCKNEELELQYRSSYARILDSKRKFLEASQRYYELSQIGGREINGLQDCNMANALSAHQDYHSSTEIDESTLEQALSSAVTCCILASAGPQRSRILANLYKDERISRLPIFGFMEKVFFERILRKEEVDSFSETLQEHQKAITGDGSTVLEKAVIEHNILAASRLYNNIYFSELSQLLSVTTDKAEQIASHMITENRLQGYIDQVENLLYFKTEKELQQWDVQIQSICSQLNGILDGCIARGLEVAS